MYLLYKDLSFNLPHTPSPDVCEGVYTVVLEEWAMINTSSVCPVYLLVQNDNNKEDGLF